MLADKNKYSRFFFYETICAIVYFHVAFFVIDNGQQFINEQVFSFKHGKKSGSIKNTQDTACRSEN